MARSSQVWILLIYSMFNVKFVDSAVNVHLNTYDQSDGLTKCETGLIEGDRFVVYGEVTYSDINLIKLLTMSIRSHGKYIPLCLETIEHLSKSEKSNCYFRKWNNVILVVLNMTAQISLSHKTLLIELFTNEHAMDSNEIQLPFITTYRNCSKIELTDCPVVAEEDMNITCTCKLASNIYRESDVRWKTTKDESYSKNAAIIAFTASRTFNGYTCFASVNQTANFSSTYKPLIIYKAHNLTCTKEIDDQYGINISCVSEKIFPQAQCLFVVINNQGKEIYKGILTYTHKTRGDNPEYFSSQCNVYFYDHDIPEAGIHNFTINMFPKGNRILDTYNFGVEKSILFYKSIIMDRPMKCSSMSSNELNITCTVEYISPKILCHFNILFNNIQLFQDNVLYTHTQIKGNPFYYASVCSLLIPYTKLETGLHVVNVSVRPDVPKEFADDVPIRVRSFHLPIESPRLRIENCTSNISEGQTVLCKCSGNVDVFIRSSFQWYKNTKERRELVSQGPDLEITNFTGNQEEYRCWALDAKYHKQYSVTFVLTVRLPKFLLTITKYNQASL